MELLKKTVALSGLISGALSVVRVGRDVGVKIVGDYEKGMLVGVKLGEETVSFLLDGESTEKECADIDVRETDPIGCVVLRENVVVSRGGAAVKPSDVLLEKEEKQEKVEEDEDKEEKEEKTELFSRLSATDGAPFYRGIREKLDDISRFIDRYK